MVLELAQKDVTIGRLEGQLLGNDVALQFLRAVAGEKIKGSIGSISEYFFREKGAEKAKPK